MEQFPLPNYEPRNNLVCAAPLFADRNPDPTSPAPVIIFKSELRGVYLRNKRRERILIYRPLQS